MTRTQNLFQTFHKINVRTGFTCLSLTSFLVETDFLQGVTPIISLWTLDQHNSQVVSIIQWIKQEKYRLSKFVLTHNLNISTKILQGVPRLRSLYPSGRHNSTVVPMNWSIFNISYVYFWGLALDEGGGWIIPSTSFSSLILKKCRVFLPKPI